MSYRNRDVDIKLQRLQHLLSKAACPLLYMLDLFVQKSSKNEGLTKDELKSSASLCKDVFQMFQVTFSDTSFKRRSLIKDDIQDRYKSLCDETTPITNNLFGDDVKDKLKELDAEFNLGKKLGKFKTGRDGYSGGRRGYNSRKRLGGKLHHRKGGMARNDSKSADKRNFLDKAGLRKKKHKKNHKFNTQQ